MLYAIVGVLVLLLDQFLKFWTVSHVELNTGIHSLLPGIVHLTHIKNFGAAFGLFSNASWLRWVLLALLIAFTVFIVLGIIKRYLRTGFARWTGLLLLVGLLGNGIDRAIYGYVVDMFELEFINFAIFNLADLLVVIFGILFCVALLCGGIGQPEEDEFDEEDEEDEPIRHRPRREEEEDEPVRRRPRTQEEAPVRA
ncbi:MAG: signal peptidase II, partial [Oscillospiraceae bacterium]|nr:signal peptidase II [Oscillospiraceae bacterium]